MNCDEFLPALETGGPLRRLRARRHASECPRCAAAAARLAALKEQWAAEPPAVTADERRAWARAAAEDEPLKPPVDRRRIRWRLAAGMAAAACALLAVSLIVRRQPDGLAGHVPDVPPTTMTAPAAPRAGPGSDRAATAAALAGLAGAVNQLDAEVRALRADAERTEARRHVVLALNRFELP